MRYKYLIGLYLLASLGIGLSACGGGGGGDDDDDDVMNSTHTSTLSHNHGKNCMDCHYPGGDGEGVFTLAGSVNKDLLNDPDVTLTIDLYTGANGTGEMVDSFEVDALGNFYTTDTIDWGVLGLYPALSDGVNNNYMFAQIKHGRCNQCHGDTVDIINF